MRYSGVLAVSIALLPSLSLSQGYTNESEVPLYGLSPPVYPTREYHDRPDLQHADKLQLVAMAQLPLHGLQHMLVQKTL
jgi:hypothetical protein